MCFSATASFATAAVTGSIGLLTIGRARTWTEIPLAAVPLLFAAQQAFEGVLWLTLGTGPSTMLTGVLANTFAVFALMLWPLWSPLAVGLAEPDRTRRALIFVVFAAAVPLAIYGAMNISANPYGACIVRHSISYANGHPYANLALAAYGICTCLPPLLSSYRSLRWFGVFVVAGLAVSTAFFLFTAFSVWCFFAAAGSLAIFGHYARLPSLAALEARIAR